MRSDDIWSNVEDVMEYTLIIEGGAGAHEMKLTQAAREYQSVQAMSCVCSRVVVLCRTQ